MMAHRTVPFVAVLLLPKVLLAFEVSTHRTLTAIALDKRKDTIEELLTRDLGEDLSLATSATVNGRVRTLSEWSLTGAEEEDTLPVFGQEGRVIYHFHDPLQPLATAGLFHGPRSSIGWAMAPRGVQEILHLQSGPMGDYYSMSWNDGRAYYLQALTAKTESERSRGLGLTLKMLGHFMHLVQDASVPAHVRNDAHLAVSGYGDPDDFHLWVAMNNDRLAALAAAPMYPVESLLRTRHPEAGNPVANLIDTDRYTGANPDAAALPSGTFGLAEYANANFFSEDTIWFDPTYPTDYPHPSSPGQADTPATSSPSALFVPLYYQLTRAGQTFLAPLVYQPAYPVKLFTVEDPAASVYQAYIAKIAPAAVGYSARAVEFFFRSNFEATATDQGTIRIKNESFEDATGIFALYYDNTSGERKKLSEWSLAIPAQSEAPERAFGVPNDAEYPGTYSLVFTGQLGYEEDAVEGRWIEPQTFRLISHSPTGVVGRTPTVSAKIGGPGGPGYMHSTLSLAGPPGSAWQPERTIATACCSTDLNELSWTAPQLLPLGNFTAHVVTFFNGSVGSPSFEASWPFSVDADLVCTGGLSSEQILEDARSPLTNFSDTRNYDWSCDLGGEVFPVRLIWTQGACGPPFCSSPWPERFTWLTDFWTPINPFPRYPTSWLPTADASAPAGFVGWSGWIDTQASGSIRGKPLTLAITSPR